MEITIWTRTYARPGVRTLRVAREGASESLAPKKGPNEAALPIQAASQ